MLLQTAYAEGLTRITTSVLEQPSQHTNPGNPATSQTLPGAVPQQQPNMHAAK
jgi:hypothetical protein